MEPPKSNEELDFRMIRARSEGGRKDIGQLAKEVGLVGEKGYPNAEAQNKVWDSLDRIKGKN
jgi:hypothetical protein